MSVNRYCPICDGSGGTHAPCLGCGKYFKTGMVLGGISPGTEGAPPLPSSNKSLEDRISTPYRISRSMPDKDSWVTMERQARNAICENARYMSTCARKFTEITYDGDNNTSEVMYLCIGCGSTFTADGLEKVLDEEDTQ